jgi:hypothetical protein
MSSELYRPSSVPVPLDALTQDAKASTATPAVLAAEEPQIEQTTEPAEVKSVEPTEPVVETIIEQAPTAEPVVENEPNIVPAADAKPVNHLGHIQATISTACQSCGAPGGEKCSFCTSSICTRCRPAHEAICEINQKWKAAGRGTTVRLGDSDALPKMR